MPEAEDIELEQLRLKRMQQMMTVKQTMAKQEEEKNKGPQIPQGIIHLNDQIFDPYLTEYKDTPVFIDYWAEWCGPCKRIAPLVETLEKKYRGKMIFAKVNTDEEQSLAMRFNIMSIPAFHIFYNLKIVDQFVGAIPAQQFEARIINILKKLRKL
jgi:thioredoxin 1